MKPLENGWPFTVPEVKLSPILPGARSFGLPTPEFGGKEFFPDPDDG